MACEKQCGFDEPESSCSVVMEQVCEEIPENQCDTILDTICDPIQEEVCDDDIELQPRTK